MKFCGVKKCRWDVHKALTIPNWLSLRVFTGNRIYLNTTLKKSGLYQSKEGLDSRETKAKKKVGLQKTKASAQEKKKLPTK